MTHRSIIPELCPHRERGRLTRTHDQWSDGDGRNERMRTLKTPKDQACSKQKVQACAKVETIDAFATTD